MPVEFVRALAARNQFLGPSGDGQNLDLDFLRDLARVHENAWPERSQMTDSTPPPRLAGEAQAKALIATT